MMKKAAYWITLYILHGILLGWLNEGVTHGTCANRRGVKCITISDWQRPRGRCGGGGVGILGNNNKLNLKRVEVWGCKQVSCGSEQGPFAGFYENGINLEVE
jgi:hypothetical protein